jgi:tRNA dimethylallyltransferase
MATIVKPLPIIAIVGPTASGKSALAMKIAQDYGGEIVCADSRTVFKYANIGTGKPTQQDQQKVPHHLLDMVSPDQVFNVAQFKHEADKVIASIQARHKIPFLVGGTGLYVDAVMYDYSFSMAYNEKIHQSLENKTIAELQELCKISNISLPKNQQNKRHLIRWIETDGHKHKSKKPLNQQNTIVGITTEKDVLLHKIHERFEQFLRSGVIEETSKLAHEYGWNNQVMSGNIYPLIKQYLEKEITLAELKEKFTTLDWHLAKRQMTWLKRNPDIHWLSIEKAEDFIRNYLEQLES